MKTPDQLGITLREYGALLATRELLNTKLVMEVTKNPRATCPLKFDMSDPGREIGCGTVACIGGTMGWILGEMYGFTSGHSNNKALGPLFYPQDRHGREYAKNLMTITKKQAVKAIDNVLRYGDAKWDTILPKSGFAAN